MRRADVKSRGRCCSLFGCGLQGLLEGAATGKSAAQCADVDSGVGVNCCLHCTWLQRSFRQPVIRTVPIGVGAPRDFMAEVARVCGVDASEAIAAAECRRLTPIGTGFLIAPMPVRMTTAKLPRDSVDAELRIQILIWTARRIALIPVRQIPQSQRREHARAAISRIDRETAVVTSPIRTRTETARLIALILPLPR
jgi:hypothetical protein